ncbi:leucyl aminopeptidase [Fusobacterium sp. PH5-44]|uniref:leucyl aminopeptidase n=1 Tax=unclassified Fusobacterium TaxID=2648384 RepID=UPI003D1D656A
MSLNIIKKAKKTYDKFVVLVEEGKINEDSTLSKESYKQLEILSKQKKFTGKKGEFLEFTYFDKKNIDDYLFIGIGKAKEISPNSIKMAIYSSLKSFRGNVLLKSNNKSFIDYDILGDLVEHINYSFDKYQTSNKKEKDKKLLNIDIVDGKISDSLIEGIELGKITNIIRDLVNEPANFMTPEILSKNAEKLGKEYGFKVKVHNEKDIENLNMSAFLAVGRASVNKPKLIVMRHNGNPKSKETLALVGKGLCYDSGGLSIKPTSSMLTMHSDMAGAATVIGVMCALSKLNIKKNVVAVIAACENVINGDAYKPGDIIPTMLGKTVEITNTDAEGRVTLADALTYATKIIKPTEIIDVATLTGAIIIALGDNITGTFTNSNKNFEKLEIAGRKWNEKFWNMPMEEEFKDAIKSHVADLKNSAGRSGSSSTAAKFLEEFVEEIPWMHLDIAGTSFAEKGNSYFKKGATGTTMKTLYEYIKNN